jgi:hypothetical protein
LFPVLGVLETQGNGFAMGSSYRVAGSSTSSLTGISQQSPPLNSNCRISQIERKNAIQVDLVMGALMRAHANRTLRRRSGGQGSTSDPAM